VDVFIFSLSFLPRGFDNAGEVVAQDVRKMFAVGILVNWPVQLWTDQPDSLDQQLALAGFWE
jgi:hypothetical protein